MAQALPLLRLEFTSTRPGNRPDSRLILLNPYQPHLAGTLCLLIGVVVALAYFRHQAEWTHLLLVMLMGAISIALLRHESSGTHELIAIEHAGNASRLRLIRANAAGEELSEPIWLSYHGYTLLFGCIAWMQVQHADISRSFFARRRHSLFIWQWPDQRYTGHDVLQQWARRWHTLVHMPSKINHGATQALDE